jgi:hypothetical protein
VAAALESLPWVEKGSVRVDLRNKQAEFAVTSKESFDREAVRQALAGRGFALGRVVSGP